MENRWLFGVVLVLFALLLACGETGEGPDGDTPDGDTPDGDTPDGDAPDGDAPDGDDPVEKVDAVTSATPRGVSLLTDSHSGWKQADCFACHENPHKNAEPLASCAACHGLNGAPVRPLQHPVTDCARCHGSSHRELNLKSPGDCMACHKFAPDGPDCPVTVDADVVVIGAGGGGLSAATTLALAGKNVVLLEKHNKVGGYMSAFTRGPYEFEISLHAMGGFNNPDVGSAAMFKALKIYDRVTPIKLDPAYRIVMPDMSLNIPADDAAYEALLVETFPEDAESIAALFTFMRETNVFFKELAAAQVAGGEVWDEFFAENRGEVLKLFSYMSMSLSDFLKDHFQNQRLHMIFTQLASYVGASPDEVQAAFFLVMWFGYTFDGYYYFEGGSKSVSEAMASVIEENGGAIRLNTLVEEIVVEDGKVVQVRTKDDACYNTNYVISNASAPTTLFDLVGRENLPESYVRRVEAMKTSLTALVLYFATDRDYTPYFEDAHEIFINESYDQAENYGWFYSNNTEKAPYLLTNYSLLVDHIAPPGHNVMVLAVYLDYDWNDAWHYFDDRESYRQFKNDVAQIFLERAERILPDLRKHITVLSIATPPTLEQFTLNPGGTFYGFHNTPANALLNRLEQKTPVGGLYLAGQWTFPGPGQSAVMQSGQIAAGLVLKEMAAPEEEQGR